MRKRPVCFGKYRSPQHDAESDCYTCVDDDDCAIQFRLKRLEERAINAAKDLEAAQRADDEASQRADDEAMNKYIAAWRASHPEMYATWMKEKEKEEGKRHG